MKNTFRKICKTRERKYTKYVLYILIKLNSELAFHQWLTKIFSVTVVTIKDIGPNKFRETPFFAAAAKSSKRFFNGCGFSAVVASDRTAAKGIS